MKIISLMENTSGRADIKSEHGLSLYIEACGRRILFDAGQTHGFIDNAHTLGVDLASVDIAIISHGHYDHGDGMTHFLRLNQTAPVYVRKRADLPYYNGERYIGLDPVLRDSDRLVIIDGEVSLGDGLKIITHDVKPANRGALTLRLGDRFIPDSFDHEHYLLIEEGGKRVLISGCSHKGVISLAERIRPDALVGGFHFMDMPLDDGLRIAGERLDALDCDYYTCHCTGVLQYEFLTKYMKRLSYLASGDRIEL